MTEKSNNNGRAFEFACLKLLHDKIATCRQVKIVENSAFEAAKRAWEKIDSPLKANFQKSAEIFATTIFNCEPRMTEKGDDFLTLAIQQDSKGETADVRDIVVARQNLCWEIGFSLKNNHKAAKHSRLSKNLDFGEKWLGTKASPDYFAEIAPIFERLERLKKEDKKWSEIPNKSTQFYLPILNAFQQELLKIALENKNAVRHLGEYLLGAFDYYKVIHFDPKKMVQIQTFNLRKTLNLSSKHAKPKLLIPACALPRKILNLRFKEKSHNTLLLQLDEGWLFSLRLHNASTRVEPSLKFDIQIKAMPTSVLVMNCFWMQNSTLNA